MLRTQFESEYRQFASSAAFALSTPEAPDSVDDLEVFERLHQIRLPDEYRHVATHIGTGDIGFAVLYSVDGGPNGIESQRSSAPGLPTTFVPVADNGCGDFYGFVVVDGRCQPEMYFADHELGYKIGPTEFSDLYEFLVRHAFRAA